MLLWGRNGVCMFSVYISVLVSTYHVVVVKSAKHINNDTAKVAFFAATFNEGTENKEDDMYYKTKKSYVELQETCFSIFGKENFMPNLQNELITHFCQRNYAQNKAFYYAYTHEIVCSPNVAEKLICACKGKDKTVVNIILKYATPEDLNQQSPTFEDHTILTYLLQYHSTIILDYEYFMILTSAGSNILLPNGEGRTPLLISIETENLMVAEYILDVLVHSKVPSNVLRQYISFRDIQGRAALWASIHTQQFSITSALLNFGADPNTDNIQGLYNPLLEAVTHGDVLLVQRLIDLGANVWATENNQRCATSVAVSLKREKMLELLLRASAESLTVRNIPDRLFVTSISHFRRRIDIIFNAIYSDINESLIVSLIEVEIAACNSELCSYTNSRGQTILFQAILAQLPKVVNLLIAYYETMERRWASGQGEGYQECYADTTDESGSCPSERLLQTTFWKTSKDTPRFINSLLSASHPRTHENCLLQAAGNADTENRIFFTFEKAARYFGVSILHLDKKNFQGLDVLAKAIYAGASHEVISRIANWLSKGYLKNQSYRLSLLTNLRIAAGGWTLPSPIVEVSANQNALRIIAGAAPVAVTEFLFTTTIIIPSDELVFRRILNTYPSPFPNTTIQSPLSQAVRSYLSPLNLIDNAALIVEMMEHRNLLRYSPKHVVHALELIGTTPDIPVRDHGRDIKALKKLMMSPRADLLTNHKHENTNASRSPFLTRILKLTLLYPMLGDEFVSPIYRLTKSVPNPVARFHSQKRATMITALLSSPLLEHGKSFKSILSQNFMNTRMHAVTVSVMSISTLLWIISSITIAYNSLSSSSLKLLPFILDLIPRPQLSWAGASLEGFRRTIMFPNVLEWMTLDFDMKYSFNVLAALTLQLFRCACFMWFLVEIFLVNQNYVSLYRNYSSSISFQQGILLVSFASLGIQAYFSKCLGNNPKSLYWWLRFAIFGKHGEIDGTIRCLATNLYWLTGSYRSNLVHHLQHQNVLHGSKIEDSSKTSSLLHAFLNGSPYDDSKIHYMARLPNMKTVGDNNADTNYGDTLVAKHISADEQEEESTLHSIAEKNANFSFYEKQSRKEDGLNKKCYQRFHYRQSQYAKRFECETMLLNPALKAFVQPRAWGDLVLLSSICFVIAQYPFWRLFHKMLYFDLYWSSSKFAAYTVPSSFMYPSLRELAILVSKWNQLFLFISPLLVELRLMKTTKDVIQSIQENFPLRFVASCVVNVNPDKSRFWDTSTLRAYIDVRQSILKQIEVIETLLSKTLRFVVGGGIVYLLITGRFLHSGQLIRYFHLPAVYDTGLRSLLYLIAFNLLVVQGSRVNYELKKSWDDLRNLYVLPPTKQLFNKESKTLIFQAVKFFQPNEFRFGVYGIQFSTRMAFVCNLFSLLLLLRMTITHKGII